MIFDFLTSMIKEVPHELSLGRMAESVILLAIIWKKLKPHLETLEKRLQGVEDGVRYGFNRGNKRFKKTEGRLKVIESRLGIETHEDPEEDEENENFRKTNHTGN